MDAPQVVRMQVVGEVMVLVIKMMLVSVYLMGFLFVCDWVLTLEQPTAIVTIPFRQASGENWLCLLLGDAWLSWWLRSGLCFASYVIGVGVFPFCP